MAAAPPTPEAGDPVRAAAAPDPPALPRDADREEATRRLSAASPTAALDRLVALAGRLLGAPSAQLSLLDDAELVAASAGGASAVGTTQPLASSLCTVAAAAGTPLVVSDAARDPRVAALPPVVAGRVGSYLGVPVRSDGGLVVGTLCVHGPEPRRWSDADVGVLTELAVVAASEMERAALAADYEADRLRWELSVAVGGVGTFDWDLATGRLSWDSRLLELFGYDADDFGQTIEAFNARVHPDDVERVGAALSAAIEAVGVFEADYRVVPPGAPMRWVHARGEALPGPDGRAARVLGAAYDTTAGRESDARLSRVLETMSAAFYSVDTEWRFNYVNAEAERLLGRRREELLGGVLWDLFPAAIDSPFEVHYRGAVATGEAAAFEAYYPPPLDGWYEIRAWPTPDGLSVYFLEITERRRALREADEARQAAERSLAEAEAASRRLELLSRVSEDLSRTLEAPDALARLGRHLVPELADWCLVSLLGEQGGLHDVGAWHADPEMLPVLEAYSAVRLAALRPGDSPMARALASGRPYLIRSGAAEQIAAVLETDESRVLMRRLAPESAAVLPLRARGRTSGVIILCRGAARAPLAGPDLTTAVEIADRAALALDNARLYGQQQQIAEGLQRSLLGAPVEPDHLQVVVRYQPAAEAARVGGDWYDAFLQPDGATVLVIGDVAGHDIQAAAAMGQVRGLLRGIAYATGAPPAQVLGTLDAAMQGLAVGTVATAVVARLEQDDDEASRGITRLRWSNAGHPPPLLLTPDGTVTALSGLRNDLLLGVVPAWRRVDQEISVDRGSTVLLYTDGLVERRDQPYDVGIEQLADAMRDLADASLDELVDGVLARMLTGPPQDDVALVAVRLHRQDRPRPDEAGPNVVPETPDPPAAP